MSVLHQQPVLPVVDAERYSAVKGAVDTAFADGHVKGFLQSLNRQKLPIREFDAALKAGLLGVSAAESYNRLSECDQAQIREIYLDLVEQVAPEWRRKFFRLYAYY